MLQFLVNNMPLVLDPKTQIRYEENFPYFDNEGIPASTVWHFDVPVIGNEEIFSYANYLMLKKKVRLYSCTIKVHGIPLGRGKLTVVNAGEAFRVSVLINDFAVQFQDVAINTMTQSNFVLGTTIQQRLGMAKEINAGNIDVPFRFPMVYAPEFYGGNNDNGLPENNPSFLRYLNNWNSATSQFIANSANYQHLNTLVPFMFLKHVINNVLKTKGWKFTGSLTADEYFNQLLVHNNFALDEKIIAHRVYASVVEPWDVTILSNIIWDMVLVDETESFVNGRYYCPEDGNYRVSGRIDFLGFPMFGDIIHLFLYAGSQTIALNIKQNPDTSIYAEFENITPASLNAGNHIAFGVISTIQNLKVDITSYIEITCINQTINNLVDVDYNNHVPVINITTLLNNTRLAFGAALFLDSESRTVEAELLNNILANHHNALDITQYIKQRSMESEFPDETPVVYTFAEKAPEILEFKYTSDLGFRLPRLVRVKNMYALATAEQAIYKSAIDSTTYELMWEFESFNFIEYKSNPSSTAPQTINMDIQAAPMATFATINDKLRPYLEGKGQSAFNEQTEQLPLMVSAWGGTSVGYPLASSVQVAGIIPKTFNFGPGNTLDSYIAKWAQWQQIREDVRVQLVGIGIWEMLELIRLNRPARGSQPQQRWVKIKGVHCLPKQFNFIIDVSGNILEAEAIVVKKREE